MLCVMQNHMVQAFANSGNAIKPVSFIRDLKSKSQFLTGWQLNPSLRWVLGGPGAQGGVRNEATGVLRPHVTALRDM